MEYQFAVLLAGLYLTLVTAVSLNSDSPALVVVSTLTVCIALWTVHGLQPSVFALFVSVFCAYSLYRSAKISGWLTGLGLGVGLAEMAALLQIYDLALSVALPAALMVPVLVVISFSRFGNLFCPDFMIEDGLILTFLMSVIFAVSPSLVDGWHSARAINYASVEAPQEVSLGLVYLGLAFMGAGILYALWKRT